MLISLCHSLRQKETVGFDKVCKLIGSLVAVWQPVEVNDAKKGESALNEIWKWHAIHCRHGWQKDHLDWEGETFQARYLKNVQYHSSVRCHSRMFYFIIKCKGVSQIRLTKPCQPYCKLFILAQYNQQNLAGPLYFQARHIISRKYVLYIYIYIKENSKSSKLATRMLKQQTCINMPLLHGSPCRTEL